jgi:hypothetical protein
MKKLLKYLTFFLSLFPLMGCQNKNAYEIKDGKIYHTWLNGGNFKKEFTPMTEADVATFEPIEQHLKVDLAKDKNHVYVNAITLKGADPATFRQIKGYYWCDNKQVYLLSTGDKKYHIVNGADPDSFAVLMEHSWAKDGNHIFFRAVQLPDVNPVEFKAIDSQWGKDKQHYYYQVYRLDSLNYAKAKIINEYYIKDDNRVFFKQKPVIGANPKTFKANTEIGYFGHDDTNMFQWEKNKGAITPEYKKLYIGK